MRCTPFYAYPSFPHNAFYASPASSDRPLYHRPHRPFSPASAPSRPSSAGPRSIINIPVYDSAPVPSPSQFVTSRPPAASPMRRAPPTVHDPSSAATAIQAHFRGFRVRRHRPLLHLHSIAKARKQLEELQAELRSPAFAHKVKADEKERLWFNEKVMAIILCLDSIEGSITEVRSQRKEATKMAIKLQDAIDAMTQKDDFVDDLSKNLDDTSSDVLLAREDDPILCEKSEQNPGLSGGSHTLIDNGMRAQDESPSLEAVDAVTECMQHVPSDHHIEMEFEETIGPSSPSSAFADGDQVEDGVFNPFPQVMQPREEMDNKELHATKEEACNDGWHAGAAEEEVSNGMEGLHLVGLDNNYMQDRDDLVDMLKQGNCMDVEHPAEGSESPRLHTCSNMDVGQFIKKGVEFCPSTPAADQAEPSDSDASHRAEPQDESLAERQAEHGMGPLDSLNSSKLKNNGCESCIHEANEEACDVEKLGCDETQSCNPPVTNAPLPEAGDTKALHQLSNDCKQLKTLVGKLVVQNKDLSKALCALNDRLEQLEHQQQLLNCQHSRQQMREKRMLKKGSKRTVRRRRNCDQ